MVKIGIIKTGNIATSLILELLLDERADRKDIEVRVVTSGAKMTPEEGEKAVEKLLQEEHDLILYSTPNPSAPGPTKVIERLKGRRAIVVGDAPGIKIKDKLAEAGLGYIFVKADCMIGARREFLDPVEMAVFNAEILKVLAVTGALRVVQEEVDRAIEGCKDGKEYLPRVIVDSALAVGASGIENPYARVKAMAAYEMAERVGEYNVKGCFMQKEPERYIPTVAAAHEALRMAARLADEAREMEKGGDAVVRRPHSSEGKTLRKTRLMEKPG
ncbi:MAG: F420-dependent methylenetetrahydromethanopterin dehydrogenase [Candidatus Hydrothermarchaeota archaeon]